MNCLRMADAGILNGGGPIAGPLGGGAPVAASERLGDSRFGVDAVGGEAIVRNGGKAVTDGVVLPVIGEENTSLTEKSKH